MQALISICQQHESGFCFSFPVPAGHAGVALMPLTDLLITPAGQEPLQVPLWHSKGGGPLPQFRNDDDEEEGSLCLSVSVSLSL